MSREHQAQVRKFCAQQGIKPAARQSGEEAKIVTLEAQLRFDSQPGEDDAENKEGITTNISRGKVQ